MPCKPARKTQSWASLLLKNLAADHLKGWSPVDHGVPRKLLSAVGTLQLSVREIFHNALLVALYEGSFPSLLVSVCDETV